MGQELRHKDGPRTVWGIVITKFENAYQYLVQAASDNMLDLPTSFLLRLEAEAVVFWYGHGERYPTTILESVLGLRPTHFGFVSAWHEVEAIMVKNERRCRNERVILSVVSSLWKKRSNMEQARKSLNSLWILLRGESVLPTWCSNRSCTKSHGGHSMFINQARDIMEQLTFPSSFEKY